MSTAQTTHPLRQRWERLQSREQRLLLVGLTLVAGALLWLLLLQPPLKALERARVQRQTLALQEQTLLQMQAQAQALQGKPTVHRRDVVLGLQTSIARLGGETTLQLQGDVARLTLSRVPAAALAGWLGSGATPAAGGAAARLLPYEARLLRSGTAEVPTWEGSLLYRLPPEGAQGQDAP